MNAATMGGDVIHELAHGASDTVRRERFGERRLPNGKEAVGGARQARARQMMDILRHKPHLAVGPLVIALIVERIALRFEVFPPGGRRGSRVLVRPQADPVLRTAGFTAKIETLIEIERLLGPFRLQEKRAALSRTCA